MKGLVGAFNQEKALVGAFSVIVQPIVEPMETIHQHHVLCMKMFNEIDNMLVWQCECCGPGARIDRPGRMVAPPV